MARKKGLEDQPAEMEPKAPLPVEAEEGASELKWGQLTAVVLGAVFLLVAIVMIFPLIPVLQESPGLPYPEIPILAVAFFVVGAVVDLSVAVTARPGALALWHQGRFADSGKMLRGWRAILSTATGGVLPGIFLYRAANRIQPLVDLEHGGMPAPGAMAVAPPVPYSPGPAPYAAGPAAYPSSPPPAAPGPSAGYSDGVAPDPFGGSRGAAPPPAPAPVGGTPSPSSIWSRPSVYSGGRPATTASVTPAPARPRSCPACGAAVDTDSRFCKACGAAVPTS